MALATILSAFAPAFAPDALPWVVLVLVAAGLSLGLRQSQRAAAGAEPPLKEPR